MNGATGKPHELDRMPTQQGLVNGEKVLMLRDTGCSSAAVSRELVRDEQMMKEVRTCVLIDGTERQFQMARVYVDTPYYTGSVEAMVMENPMFALILGNVTGVRNGPDPEWKSEGNSAWTRVQTRKRRKPKPHYGSADHPSRLMRTR